MFRAFEIGKVEYKSVPKVLKESGQAPDSWADFKLDPPLSPLSPLSSPLPAPAAASPCGYAKPKPSFLRTHERVCAALSPLARRPSPSPSPMSRSGRTQHFTLNLKPRTFGTTQTKDAKTTSRKNDAARFASSATTGRREQKGEEKYAAEETILGRVSRALPNNTAETPCEKKDDRVKKSTKVPSFTPSILSLAAADDKKKSDPEEDLNLLTSPAGRQTGTLTKTESLVSSLRNVSEGLVRTLKPGKSETTDGKRAPPVKEKKTFTIKNLFGSKTEVPEENTLLTGR